MLNSEHLKNQWESLPQAVKYTLVSVVVSAFFSIIFVFLLTSLLVEGKTKNYLTKDDINFLQEQNSSLNNEMDELSRTVELISNLSEQIELDHIKLKNLEKKYLSSNEKLLENLFKLTQPKQENPQIQEQKFEPEKSDKTSDFLYLKGVTIVSSLKNNLEKGESLSDNWNSLRKLFETDLAMSDTINAISPYFHQEVLSLQKLKDLLQQVLSSRLASAVPTASNDTQPSPSKWKNLLQKGINKIVTIQKVDNVQKTVIESSLQKAIFYLEQSNIKEAIDALIPCATEPDIAPSYRALQDHLNTKQSLSQLEQKLLQMIKESPTQGAVS